MCKPVNAMEELMIDRNSYTYVNSKAWDNWVEDGIEWGVPISHDEYMRVFEGLWAVSYTHLTLPTKRIV